LIPTPNLLYCNQLTTTFQKGAGIVIINKKDVSIQEIRPIFENQGRSVGDTIFDLLKCFKLNLICQSLDVIKHTGYSIPEMIIILTMFPILMIKTVRGFILSNYQLTEAQKDTFFRVLNNQQMNWRNFLYAVAKRFRSMAPKTEDHPTPTCGIIDDTVLEKTGKHIEGISMVFDHILKKLVLGFKCQLYSYWDGKSIYPIDFSLHAEIGRNQKRPFGMTRKQLKQRYQKDRSSESQGRKRFKELTKDKISTALSVIKRAAKHGFVPQYLLVDSWYTSEKFILTVRKIKKGAVHLLGMVRQDKRQFNYQDKKHNAKELRKMLKTNAKRCRKLKATYIEVVVEYKDVGRVKLYFSRFSHRGSWQLLLSTDCSLSFIKAVEIYNIRWGIEVLFKECKQHLNLGKCQSNDFDAQIAETTLSLVLFTMLAFYKRMHAYESMGILFDKLSDQMIETTIAERLWQLFIQLLIKLAELFEIEPAEQLEKLLYADELMIEIQAILGLFPSVQMQQSLNNAA
jgi:hypothetical protein